MLTRLSLVAAIIAGLTITVIGFAFWKPQVNRLQKQLVQERQEKLKSVSALATANQKFSELREELLKASNQIAAVELARSNAEQNISKLEGEVREAKIGLAKGTQDKGDFSKANAVSEQKLEQMALQVEALQDENKILRKKVESLKIIVYGDSGRNFDALKGEVTAIDPKWQIVVLNLGSKNELREGDVMLVYRNSNLVAKVKVNKVNEELRRHRHPWLEIG